MERRFDNNILNVRILNFKIKKPCGEKAWC